MRASVARSGRREVERVGTFRRAPGRARGAGLNRRLAPDVVRASRAGRRGGFGQGYYAGYRDGRRDGWRDGRWGRRGWGGDRWSLGLFVGGNGLGLNLGYSNFGWGNQWGFGFNNWGGGFGGWGGGFGGWGGAWGNPWCFAYSPVVAPAWHSPWGWRRSWWGGWGYNAGFFGNAGWGCGLGTWGFRPWGWRYGAGFGYACDPFWFGGFNYPRWRVYNYLPYTYYSTVAYYPAYSTVFHTNVDTVAYADVNDPYVDFIDEEPVTVPTTLAPPALPEPFMKPFMDGFPEGLSPTECIARGEDWLKSGQYPMAAEAFRRAWLGQPDDYYAPVQLGLPLFAMGRYDLAAHAVHEGLDRNGSFLSRPLQLPLLFSAPAEFGRPLTELKRHIARNPLANEARFLLAFLYHGSGQYFEAQRELSALKEAGWESQHIQPMIDEAGAALMREDV